MSAAIKDGLKIHLQRHSSVRNVWTSRRNSITDPIATSNGFANQLAHQLRQSKSCSRYPQSIFRRTKEVEISPTSVMSSPSKFGPVSWYLSMIKSRPIVTKSITSALIYSAADFSSQSIVEKSSEGYDYVRTLRMAGYGMIILGPSLHYWFNFVSRVFPKRDLPSTFKKMALGQTVYGPTMTSIFFSVNAALQGETGSEIVARLKRDLVPTILSGIMYWPGCDFVTFKFIPVNLQPLVSNGFSYLWTVYMTYMASLEKVSTV
ncbi:PXMP2/4 family protein 4-like [Olea europaea var. sylvestris]|uniref:PXMP2/4 family protein 4-like n=1 Tax=Olea europaea var. sylvestris TaxID=158386 RepID=UPI000C1D3960|nr:PXMP2/4 family protein 4-like [Olea europaea var. sylvestris]